MPGQIRLAELLGSFALAGDLGQGQSLGHVLSTTQVASRLAERLNLPADQQADVFYTALLLHSGCTAGASDMAAFLLNDELAAQAELCLFDPDNVVQIMKWMTQNIAPGWPLYLRVVRTLRSMAKGEEMIREMFSGWSDVASLTAARLSMPATTQQSLYSICETWNGKGPHRRRGPDIPLPARIVSVAMTLEILRDCFLSGRVSSRDLPSEAAARPTDA